jgi:hypothetical protein
MAATATPAQRPPQMATASLTHTMPQWRATAAPTTRSAPTTACLLRTPCRTGAATQRCHSVALATLRAASVGHVAACRQQKRLQVQPWSVRTSDIVCNCASRLSTDTSSPESGQTSGRLVGMRVEGSADRATERQGPGAAPQAVGSAERPQGQQQQRPQPAPRTGNGGGPRLASGPPRRSAPQVRMWRCPPHPSASSCQRHHGIA